MNPLKPYKIIWLCHFNNQRVNNFIEPDKPINEFAPWITLLIDLFIGNDQVEIHIVAPNLFHSKNEYLNERNIHYHFFDIGIPFLNRPWPWFIALPTNFIWNKYQIKKIVQKIKPDLIHLHGVENAYYSSGIFQFRNKYPVLVTIQGFIALTRYKGYRVRKNIITEEKILKNFHHFGVRADFMLDYIRKKNSFARFHWHNYPVKTVELKSSSIEKEYDIVYFANISKDKGIEDLIEAIAIVKLEMPEISVKIIGKGNRKYLTFLKKKIKDDKLNNNIHFLGFYNTQEELLNEVAKAKICVLPTYHDIMPGTVIESMLLGVPVISYKVGGLPDLNKETETIVLVEKGDIIELADSIHQLLENPILRKEIALRASKYSRDAFDNSKIAPSILAIYKKVYFNHINIE